MPAIATPFQIARTLAARAPGRLFRIDCELSYEVTAATEFIFLIHALDCEEQNVASESLALHPALSHRVFADWHGQRHIRLQAGPGAFTLHYRADVHKPVPVKHQEAGEVAIGELPDDLLPLLTPTRYCESDLLGRAARRLFGELPPGESRVQAICDWIPANIEYAIGSTDATSTARDVFVQRAGVCRDFAHLGITFCRALNIPARLVVGYAPFDTPPPDFHAVFEAWLGGRWMLFDPTRMSPLDSLVRIASGRDAKDVAFASMFGPARMVTMNPCISEVAPETPA